MTTTQFARCTGLFIVAAFGTVALSGCGGGAGAEYPLGAQATYANLPNYHAPEEWLSLLEAAGLQDYADLGRELLAAGRVKFVAPPVLDARVNACSFIADREVYVNAPMFSRYPTCVEQATIFLHELIHIASSESSHTGPAWAAQDQFAVYWRNHPLPTAAP